jgi:hypothetical protein
MGPKTLSCRVWILALQATWKVMEGVVSTSERYLQWELTKTSLSRGPCKYSRDPTRSSLANTPIITQQTDLLVRANKYDVDDLFSAVLRRV